MKQFQRQDTVQRSDISRCQVSPSWGKSHGKVSIELKISPGNLRTAIREGKDWLTIKDILDVLGFDVKIVHMVVVLDKDNAMGDSRRSVPRTIAVQNKQIHRGSLPQSSLRMPGTSGGVIRRIR